MSDPGGDGHRPAGEQLEPLDRGEFDSATLMRQHSPVVRNPNKLAVFRIACPDGTAAGRISYGRWPEMSLPATVKAARAAGRAEVRERGRPGHLFATPHAHNEGTRGSHSRLAVSARLRATDRCQSSLASMVGT